MPSNEPAVFDTRSYSITEGIFWRNARNDLELGCTDRQDGELAGNRLWLNGRSSSIVVGKPSHPIASGSNR